MFDLDGDGKVRRWHLWEAACGAAGEPIVRPSFQLLVEAPLDASEPERAALAEGLTRLTPRDCAPPDPDQAHGDRPHGPEAESAHPVVALGGRQVHLQPHPTEGRVIYRIPWRLAKGGSRPLVELDGRRVPLLSVRSAGAIGDAASAVSGEWLRGHLVIVGSSYEESRDLYMTPIGRMPGALVIANAVLSLGSHGDLHTPGLIETLALEAVLILLMSYRERRK